MLKVVCVSVHVRWVLTNYTNHPGGKSSAAAMLESEETMRTRLMKIL